jgi:alkaline phosphatase
MELPAVSRISFLQLVLCLTWCAAATAQTAEAPSSDDAQADLVKQLQTDAIRNKRADWGHWGPRSDIYNGYQRHSNRLIPVYTFGGTLDELRKQNPYHSEQRLEQLFGRVPDATLNPHAEYLDQTQIYTLQRTAAEQGKKNIILIVFDGMDWQTTWAAATHAAGKVAYREGRGTGLYFQDYRGATTDYGFFVTSPRHSGTKYDIDVQRVIVEGDTELGGYDPQLGGATPWDPGSDPNYVIGKNAARPHGVTDSASSATSLCSGIKTYDQAINIDHTGKQVEPISRLLQKQGRSVGVVTSVPISHATPACAYANNVERYDYQDLARDLVGRPSVAHPSQPLPGVDVLLGCGWGWTLEKDKNQGSDFVPGNAYLPDADLQAIDAKNGGPYHVVMRQAGVNGRQSLMDAAQQAIEKKQRLFGFYGAKGFAPPGTVSGHLPYRTADGKFDPAVGSFNTAEKYTQADIDENPTLADFVTAALSVLEKNPKGFWMMIESGDVDWSNHDNNIDNSIGTVKAGDDAFRAVVEWVEKNNAWDETLVVLTADHGHDLNLLKPEALVGAPSESSAGGAN